MYSVESLIALSLVQVASKLSEEDKATVSKAIDETIEWLDANQLAEEGGIQSQAGGARKDSQPNHGQDLPGRGRVACPEVCREACLAVACQELAVALPLQAPMEAPPSW